ncbi:IS3 family transposase [Escherichia coli]|uniref:IS3 family transposase n=10 Tax=Escherichia coli TaxID=562 RepID=UPI000A18837F|nr:IS3 family transposase [Escherichia coli]AZW05495.1 IS3 family transposase [Escherichia coli]MBN6634568.1 IS3 family transposase [Escherichia coli]MDT9428353.1 IS3 family transposase [Escherichia coli]MDT9442117.1 IS3 family transposase [Escherichia coli]MDT9463397.1 IS3 family transposase [Escherichia coli]
MTKTVSTSKKPRKQHSPEFRSEALKLAERIGVTAAARELSLYESQLYNWRSKQQNQQTSSERELEMSTEIARLKRQLAERDEELATRPNEKWVTDVTEFAVNGRKLYLSPVIDLFNNEVISYSLSERPVMNMVENMLDQAFKKLNPHEHPVLHSDQGWQYRMRRYQNILKEHGIKQSMSRKGNCLDNAVVECFFGTLKSECFYLDEFSNISELKDAVTEYIEYYNSRRISLKLKGLTPIEYRNQTYMPRV